MTIPPIEPALSKSKASELDLANAAKITKQKVLSNKKKVVTDADKFVADVGANDNDQCMYSQSSVTFLEDHKLDKFKI